MMLRLACCAGVGCVAVGIFACAPAAPAPDGALVYEEAFPGEDSSQTSEEALLSNVDCTPVQETAYSQGKPYPITVIRIAGKKVGLNAGHAFLKMQKAAHQAGVSLSLVSGFRTYAEQAYLYDCYLTGSCNGGALAAPPGYSNHQNGIALDVSVSNWMLAHAWEFGFQHTVPSEDWHIEYTWGGDPGGPCSGGGSSAMFGWVSPKNGGWYKNGIWFKVKPTSPSVRTVAFYAGNYKLGESSDSSQNFAVRYTFNQLGWRSITAYAMDANRKDLGYSTITIKVEP